MERGPSAHEVTILPQAWSSGSNEAFERLTPLVYRELRQITDCLIAGRRPNHTLQATALVNEVYVRPVHPRKAVWQDRVHSFVLCAPAMPQILIDHACASGKRGGGQLSIELDEALLASPSPTANLLEIDDALKRLAQLDPRNSQVVKRRFFGEPQSERSCQGPQGFHENHAERLVRGPSVALRGTEREATR
jgi:RNA polymerase sigma factor (TIGR02999 family)